MTTLPGWFVSLVWGWSDDYTNEKIAMEVTALSLIHNRTTIPILKI